MSCTFDTFFDDIRRSVLARNIPANILLEVMRQNQGWEKWFQGEIYMALRTSQHQPDAILQEVRNFADNTLLSMDFALLTQNFASGKEQAALNYGSNKFRDFGSTSAVAIELKCQTNAEDGKKFSRRVMSDISKLNQDLAVGNPNPHVDRILRNSRIMKMMIAISKDRVSSEHLVKEVEARDRKKSIARYGSPFIQDYAFNVFLFKASFSE